MICKNCDHGMTEACSVCRQDTCTSCDTKAAAFFETNQNYVVVCGRCVHSVSPEQWEEIWRYAKS
jgi:hypothetical protein